VVVNILATCSSLITLIAGQLDVAVIQFPEQESLAETSKRFRASEPLRADRRRSDTKRQRYLRGRLCFLGERFSAMPDSSFSASTRLKKASAKVTGRWDYASLALLISLTDGIKAGLRAFQKKSTQAPVRFRLGLPVLGVRQVRGRSPNVVKDQTRMQSYFLTTVVVA
jgi:hypothetical protein